jgi:hypothetical protein
LYVGGDGDIPGKLWRVWDATPLDDGGIILVDRGEDRGDTVPTGWVRCLDPFNRLRWGFTAMQGRMVGELMDPFSAEPASASTTLITDSLGCRVIEVDNNTGDVVWFYGEYGVKGSGPGQLRLPHSAQRLPDGNTLICDSENHRVIEVTRQKGVAWSFSTGGTIGETGPNTAVRLTSGPSQGDTLICDSDKNRVIEVDKSGTVVREYPGLAGGSLDNPRAAVRAPDGSTIIADYGNRRLVRFRHKTRFEYVATSGAIDPARGKIKWFTKLTVDAARPAGSAVLAEYSMDGHTWDDVPASGALPASAKGSAIRYRLRLSTTRYDSAPVVNGVSITWRDTAPGTSTDDGDSYHNDEVSDGKGSSAGKGGSSSSSKSSSKRSTSKRTGSSRTVGTGSGSTESTTVAAGGDSAAIGGGTSGSADGTGGDAVTSSTTMSGWLMSEVKDDVGGNSGKSGVGGFEAGRSLGGSGIPGIALVFAVYTLGVAWSPSSRVLGRLIAAVLPT